jgi:hypothetical protein
VELPEKCSSAASPGTGDLHEGRGCASGLRSHKVEKLQESLLLVLPPNELERRRGLVGELGSIAFVAALRRAA